MLKTSTENPKFSTVLQSSLSHTAQKVNTFTASNKSRKVSVTVPYMYAQKGSTTYCSRLSPYNANNFPSLNFTAKSQHNVNIFRSYLTHNFALVVPFS